MIKKVFKNIFIIFKYIFLFFIYCSAPNKYDGETFEQWMNNQ